MLAISEGAAILSHRLADTYECPQCGRQVSQSDRLCEKCGFDLEKYTIEEGVLDIVHSAAHDYYIYLENNERQPFVEKNTPLPCEKTEVFKLVHPEQKLVHMKFFNVVNEKEESIGDLWLGIDKEDREDQEGTLHVEITLNIDENNLIEVTAALKEHPDIQLSKTLSRGKADEKLFLSLEETITEANRSQYGEYVMIDLTHRSLSAIKDINNVVDPETSEVDESVYDRAVVKIEKARKIAAENHSSRTTIYYARNVLGNFGPVISPKDQATVKKRIKRLEEMDESGTYEENVKALTDLDDAVDNLGGVNVLMEIKKAGDLCTESDPAKAPKFYRSIQDILKAHKDGDKDRAGTLLNKIMPEVRDIVGEFESKTGVIHKDITRN